VLRGGRFRRAFSTGAPFGGKAKQHIASTTARTCASEGRPRGLGAPSSRTAPGPREDRSISARFDHGVGHPRGAILPVLGQENRAKQRSSRLLFARELCALKVCAGSPVARQPNDLCDREPALLPRHVDGLADASQSADAIEQHVPGGRRHAQQISLGLNRPRCRRRGLLLRPDVHLHVLPRLLLLQLLANLGELELLASHPGAKGLDQLVASSGAKRAVERARARAPAQAGTAAATGAVAPAARVLGTLPHWFGRRGAEPDGLRNRLCASASGVLRLRRAPPRFGLKGRGCGSRTARAPEAGARGLGHSARSLRPAGVGSARAAADLDTGVWLGLRPVGSDSGGADIGGPGMSPPPAPGRRAKLGRLEHGSAISTGGVGWNTGSGSGSGSVRVRVRVRVRRRRRRFRGQAQEAEEAQEERPRRAEAWARRLFERGRQAVPPDGGAAAAPTAARAEAVATPQVRSARRAGPAHAGRGSARPARPARPALRATASARLAPAPAPRVPRFGTLTDGTRSFARSHARRAGQGAEPSEPTPLHEEPRAGRAGRADPRPA